MDQLLLVRHGQASFFDANYDRLSALGADQAYRLGAHWADAGLQPARAYVGPRQRHAQTYEQVARAYRERGLEFPAAEWLPGLDEHHGIAVAKAHLGEPDPAGGAMPGVPAASAALPAETAKAVALKALLRVLRDWAHGRVVVPGFETWEEFRARVLGTMDRLCAVPAGGPGVAFTSGGFVSAATGGVLGLDHDRVIDLHAVIRNASVTEFGFAGTRRRLVEFNVTSHLPTAALRTLI